MIRHPKVISLSERRPSKPVPVTVILGMPDDSQEAAIARWILSRPELHFAHLKPAPPDNPDTEDCPQCILLQKTLRQLESLLKQPRSHLDGIFVESPTELDPRKLIEELVEVPEIRIDSVITWIEAGTFLKDFSSAQDPWIDQLEFCNVHALSGLDGLPKQEQDSICLILNTLQPSAIQIACNHLETGTETGVEAWAENLFSSKLFDPRKIHLACAWKKTLEEKQPSPHYFKSKRPFHPTRLNDLISNWPEGILRSFGTVWLASHNDMALTLSHTGPSGFFFSPEGYWIGTLDQKDQNFALQEHPELLSDWDQKYGDRLNELAFVASEPLDHKWTHRLNACLLSDVEMFMDWSKFPNPFPTFEDENFELEKKSPHLQIVSGNPAGDLVRGLARGPE